MNRTKLITVITLVLLAATWRVLSLEFSWWNIAPIGAIALFGGAMFERKWMAFIIPVFALLVSDLLMMNTDKYYGEYMQSGSFLLNYVCFFAVVAIGFILRNRVTVLNVLAGSVASSIVFFALSNFASWIVNIDNTYTRDFAGLVKCYTMAIPFFKGTFYSDFIFNTVLFGSYFLLSTRMPALRPTSK